MQSCSGGRDADRKRAGSGTENWALHAFNEMRGVFVSTVTYSKSNKQCVFLDSLQKELMQSRTTRDGPMSPVKEQPVRGHGFMVLGWARKKYNPAEEKPMKQYRAKRAIKMKYMEPIKKSCTTRNMNSRKTTFSENNCPAPGLQKVAWFLTSHDLHPPHPPGCNCASRFYSTPLLPLPWHILRYCAWRFHNGSWILGGFP